MGLGSIVRRAVAIADRVTGGADGVQVQVTHHVKNGQAVDGTKTFATGVAVMALLEDSQRRFVSPTGNEQVARGVLTFLSDITVARDDEFTMPDGYRAPVLLVQGLTDPTTARGFVIQVFLGWQGRNL